MSRSNCCLLTWIQVSQEVDQVVWYSHLFQNFPQFIVIHTVKGFGIVNKAEIDVFLELISGILLTQEKKKIWFTWTEMDNPTAYYTEWSKTEENKYQVLMESRRNSTNEQYFHGKNRNSDIEKKYVNQKGKEKLGWIESGMLTSIPFLEYMTD